ncbi:DNA primase [Nitzschia inconspicua]|uniref:DNA-directed primase/polymerase protein n=1 Tax=Nitzschia inconspicua TaxID=303405 RepID=A0A9K3LPM4_9STRA|nr:DNA primase [Nitzschia inconspicua]
MSLSPTKTCRRRDEREFSNTINNSRAERRRTSVGDGNKSDDSIDCEDDQQSKLSLPHWQVSLEKENDDNASACRWGSSRNALQSSSPRKHSRSAKKKSHGLSPTQFHKKKTDSDHTTLPEWKQTLELSLLIQQHQQHTQALEQRRKHFRSQTQLKLWPLQDMALEHLDHLLGGKADSQFHGGDYLSAESSSSVSSVETSRPRLKRSEGGPQHAPVTPSNQDTVEDDNSEYHDSTRKQYQEDDAATSQPQSPSPLWSLEPRIFAIEKSHGKRKYLVGHFGRIADWYWRKAGPPRHLYEVIREDTPCRLYFDLEFSKECNPELAENSSQLLQELQGELVEDLKTHYNLPLESSQIINLDSSNDSKFSRHWIVHLREGHDRSQNDKEEDNSTDQNNVDDVSQSGKELVNQEVLFRDAQTVGRFVKRLVSRLAEERAVEGGDFVKRCPMLSKYLFVRTKDADKPTCFIDLGVYTRNRLFRCLGSSKFGKGATLQAILQEENETSLQHYFPLNLPPNKKLELSQSSQPMSMKDFVAANDWEPHATALADSLVVPLQAWPLDENRDKLEHSKPPTRVLEVLDELYGGITAGTLLGTSKGNSNYSVKAHRPAPTIHMARQGSRLPTLDKFVHEVLAVRGGTQGSIRAWSIEYGHRDLPLSITYQIQKNRFCELIGRSHKSNNIFWTIDLTSWSCIQGCHDRDCYGRGSPVPIPNDDGQLDAIQKEFQVWSEEEFEKALMSLNIDDVVAKAKRDDDEETSKELNHDDSSYGDVFDDALFQAISQNPELFP